MTIHVFWDVVPCYPVNRQRFGVVVLEHMGVNVGKGDWNSESLGVIVLCTEWSCRLSRQDS